jgi:hypothetical protein
LRYTASIDPCRLPDPKTLIYLTHDLVEVPLNTVPPLDRPVAPRDAADKPDEFKTCEKVYAYIGAGGVPDLRGLRYVTIAVARYQGPAADANSRARKLMADGLDGPDGQPDAEIVPPTQVRDVGDETIVTSTGGIARSGNVVLSICFVDQGRLAGITGVPTADNIAAVITDIVKDLSILYSDLPAR